MFIRIAALAAIVATGVFIYSKRAGATESTSNDSVLDFVPIDFGKYERTYNNEIGDSMSKDINNPLNIRYNKNNNWVGQTGEMKGFCVFSSPEYCYRAGAIILRNYAKRGINTLSKIIETWAPRFENPTDSYISFVSKNAGIATNAVVTPEQYPALLASMTRFEIGSFPYAMTTVKNGVKMA